MTILLGDGLFYIYQFGESFQFFNSELNHLKKIICLRKLCFSIALISGSISLIIREEYGIHCMPCSSRIIIEMTPQTCYHKNYRPIHCCA